MVTLCLTYSSVNITHAKVIIVNEAYTTKTCSKGGNLNKSIGGKRSSNAQYQSVMVMDRGHIFSKNKYASVGDFSFPNFGAYPLQSSDCCMETEMESLETFDDFEV